MNALSERQALACETAKNPRCRCRCGGALHGKGRALEYLPDDDPHFVESLDPQLPLPLEDE